MHAVVNGCGRKRVFSTVGICYDHVNNQIWTSSDDCIEEWYCSGASSYHNVVHKLSPKPKGIWLGFNENRMKVRAEGGFAVLNFSEGY